jgi:hypothetical protein
LYACLNTWGLTIAAGRCAELSVLQYALGINYFKYELCEIRQSYLCKGAALAGDLIKLQWLHTGKGYSMTSAVSERAASSGSVEILKWLAAVCDDNIVHTKGVMTAACGSGQLQTVQYLIGRACPLSERHCYGEAARGGHLALIKWMATTEPFSSNLNIDINTNIMMHCAAASGSIEVMQWLRAEHHVPFSASMMCSAAKCNQLAVMRYLRAEGCPWDASACTAATTYCGYRGAGADDELTTLQWLRDHGCPWDVANVRKVAPRSGSMGLLSYAIQQGGAPAAADLTLMLNVAGANHKLEAAKWLRQQGAEWPAVLQHKQGRLLVAWWGPSLDWARSEGCTSEAPSLTHQLIQQH